MNVTAISNSILCSLLQRRTARVPTSDSQQARGGRRRRRPPGWLSLALALLTACSGFGGDRIDVLPPTPTQHAEKVTLKTPLKNVLGTELAPCCQEPPTGYFRDGFCRTADADHGTHVICAVVDAAFLDFTRSRGNDLTTPHPAYQFPGLKPGDRWCLCALRWREALVAGVAPPVRLAATHARALKFVELAQLEAHAYPEP